MVASTSGSLPIFAGTLLPPLTREETSSMAELSWLIFLFNVCLVLCFQEQHKSIIKNTGYPSGTEELSEREL